MTSALEQLKTMTDIMADTGDIEAIKHYTPTDATTNPSLLYKAALLPQYDTLLNDAIAQAQQQEQHPDSQHQLAADLFAVAIGCEILNIIPGRISTEVDARLSFDTPATVAKAKQLIALYQQQGISQERILIKIASTWEGIKAAEQLEQAGIQCNLTLLFSLTQAIACADAGVYLISPFVGRILDWHKQHSGKTSYAPTEDPGVQSVTDIYHYYKQHNINTIVMGASFRNTDEIIALAGCDRLTISPSLMEELANNQDPIERALPSAGIPLTNTASTHIASMDNIRLTESAFSYQLNEDAMATEKLSEGIRNFITDQRKLEVLIKQRMQ